MKTNASLISSSNVGQLGLQFIAKEVLCHGCVRRTKVATILVKVRLDVLSAKLRKFKAGMV